MLEIQVVSFCLALYVLDIELQFDRTQGHPFSLQP